MAGVCTVQDGKKEVSCILVPNGTKGYTQKKMTKKMILSLRVPVKLL